ncbi:MAG: HemK/PrmC family methyltransferase [Candidatus Absconditabacteria bacterium]
MKIISMITSNDFNHKKILEKIIMHNLGLDKTQLITQSENEISDEMVTKIKIDYKRFVDDKEPLEFIFGYVEFFGNKFTVNKNTLIPRPETEYMINAVRNHCNDNTNNILIDLGTGCGVLGISTMIFKDEAIQKAYLTDYSKEALLVAKTNKEIFLKDNEKITFYESDMLKVFENGEIDKNEKILIVANLPYIPEDVFEQNVEESAKIWEPKMAFVGGEDGLIYYRIMLDQIMDYDWKDVTMFLEMMGWQADILSNEFSENFEFEIVDTFHFNIKILKGKRKA